MRIGRQSVGFSFALAGLDQRRGDALRNDPGQQGLGYDLRRCRCAGMSARRVGRARKINSLHHLSLKMETSG
jgi:hypothetical protein